MDRIPYFRMKAGVRLLVEEKLGKTNLFPDMSGTA